MKQTGVREEEAEEEKEQKKSQNGNNYEIQQNTRNRMSFNWNLMLQ